MMSVKILEVCVDNYQSAVAAISGGANRLELCSSLGDGGLTPTPGLLKQIKTFNQDILIFCMLRCRTSNFIYSTEEINIMVEDVYILKKYGADGFVFGALNIKNEVDLKQCREIIKACHPLPVTFHRAFDLCIQPNIQLECLIDLGFQRLLTSGQKKSAEEGIDLIKQLMSRARNRIIIMPGAGVTKDNIKLLIKETQAIEYHGSFKIQEINDMSINSNQNFGDLIITDAKIVSEVVHILKTTEFL